MAGRIEKDSLGEMEVPQDALWGAQTQRAVLNFPISGIRLPRRMIASLGLIKRTAAIVNCELGLLDEELRDAIVEAAGEVMDGKWDAHFPVDIFQTGSGTSSNMNANEVIANRASQILGAEIGSKRVHPNDHVNRGQSSNDVFPTAIHLAAYGALEEELLPALESLWRTLLMKQDEFDKVVKVGRTHLQDATPIRLGQEFSGYARQIEQSMGHIRSTEAHLGELALGGTAVGTGVNAHPQFAGRCIELFREQTSYPLREAENHFEAQAAQDSLVALSGALKVTAVALTKIANDIRWMGSGPRLGLGELVVPSVQPGSSIMPGKVNPVLCESVVQVAAQVIGNDAAIAIGGLDGHFELLVMLPVMAHNLLQSIEILAGVVQVFTQKCVAGLKADEERCGNMVERSLMNITPLAVIVGYDKAAEIAKEAQEQNRTIREVVLEKNLLDEKQVDQVLDPISMTDPGIASE